MTYLGRVSADVTSDMLAYASISTGYKSGGLEDGGLQYEPETLTNYEIGTKNRLFGGLMTWNNAAFYEDFRGFQYAAPVTFSDGSHGLEFSNAGGDTIVYGLESELAIKPTPQDTVQFSASLLHTELGYLPAAAVTIITICRIASPIPGSAIAWTQPVTRYRTAPPSRCK